MKIRAVFTGTDGSLGYRRNAVYDLRVFALRVRFLSRGPQIRIERMDGSGSCPYTNIETFLANWSGITVLEA